MCKLRLILELALKALFFVIPVISLFGVIYQYTGGYKYSHYDDYELDNAYKKLQVTMCKHVGGVTAGRECHIDSLRGKELYTSRRGYKLILAESDTSQSAFFKKNPFEKQEKIKNTFTLIIEKRKLEYEEIKYIKDHHPYFSTEDLELQAIVKFGSKIEIEQRKGKIVSFVEHCFILGEEHNGYVTLYRLPTRVAKQLHIIVKDMDRLHENFSKYIGEAIKLKLSNNEHYFKANGELVTSSLDRILFFKSTEVLKSSNNFRGLSLGGKGWLRSFYLSAITFFTIGYGDIVPTNPITKIWISIEALIGLLFLGIFSGYAYSKWNTQSDSK